MSQDKIIQMAKEAGLRWWWAGGNDNYDEFIEYLSRFRDLVLSEALNCYSPDDTAQDWADKICALKEKP